MPCVSVLEYQIGTATAVYFLKTCYINYRYCDNYESALDHFFNVTNIQLIYSKTYHNPCLHKEICTLYFAPSLTNDKQFFDKALEIPM